jgi:hypothetical protein
MARYLLKILDKLQEDIMNKKLLFLLLLSLGLIVRTYAQNAEPSSTDTSGTDTEWKDWDNNQDKDWDHVSANLFDFKIKGAPTINLDYGGARMNLKSIHDKFAKPGMLELKLGYTSEKSYNGSDYVKKYDFKYFHISNFTANLSGNQNSNDLITNCWRFGLGDATGFGYELGNGFVITPYNMSSFDWTMVNMQKTPSNAADIYTTDLYNKTFRFGNSVQGGIQVKFTDNIGIDASYERSIVYSRHLFWKWGGSEIIEVIGQSLVDKFVEEILDTTPSAVPVVNFLLKNALSYGLFELRQDKMNWPFETVPPLAFDTYKVGFTFVF